MAGDKFVVVEYTSAGTFDNAEPSSPAYTKGKKYELKNCSLFEIKSGRIICFTTYFDQVSFLKHMGFFNQPR